MTIGEHIMLIRKGKKLSQADLGKEVGTSGDIIGRYERGLITPSIDVIIKIADALEVSLDYLAGKTNLELDKQTLSRIEEISQLSEENRNFILQMVDMAIQNFKTKKAFG